MANAEHIRNNPRVEIAPSGARGKPLGDTIPAQARFIEGDAAKHALGLLKRRYGFQFTLIEWLDKLRGGSTKGRVFIEIVPGE